jgi:hypothetical protein
MLLFLRLLYNHERNRFADGTTFGYADMVAFFDVYAWGVVAGDVAASFFVSDEFGAELQVFAFNYDCFVHFGANDYAV